MSKNNPKFKPFVAVLALGFISSCGGGGDGINNDIGSATLSGTVPGTLIEVFADNGAYYQVESQDNGTAQHPFELVVPPGIGLRLVMTTNKGTPEQVVSPIGFRDNTTHPHTRWVLSPNEHVDLGYVPLAVSHVAALADVDGDGDNDDLDGDGVLDSPFMLDDAHSVLAYADADQDGINDFDDPDHGGYHYTSGSHDPIDHDGDGIPNMYDPDYQPAPGFVDSDRDGLHDFTDDANPGNTVKTNIRFQDDLNGDGYHQDDLNHDGFHDDDRDRDGFHDDDLNKDGYHDDDMNRDGFHDNDMDHDGMVDNHRI